MLRSTNSRLNHKIINLFSFLLIKYFISTIISIFGA